MMTPSAAPAPTDLKRCPACGQRAKSPTSAKCGLCGFDLGFTDQRSTGDDVTPYAKAYSLHHSGWWLMSEWVWFAGAHRLKHLALMRASVASRRFARLNGLLIATALAVFQGSRVGWRFVADSPVVEPTGSTSPSGQGWLHLAAAPRPLPAELPREVPVDLWWNPVHMVIATVAAWLSALLLIWLAMSLIRVGVTKAHARSFRREQRMTAAVHYGTAWGILLFLAGLAAAMRPIAYFGSIVRWAWYPPERVFDLSSGVIAGLAVALAWFWGVRVGATAPAETRGRVVAFWALGAPVVVVAAAAAWWFGLDILHRSMFRALGVSF